MWWLFPLFPAESRRGLPKGSACRRWEPGSTVGFLSWTTPQQPGPARRGWPMNSDAYPVSWAGRRTAAKATAVETRGLVYCLSMPGWALTWLNNHFWSITEEPEGSNEGIMSCIYKNDFAPVFREPRKGRGRASAPFSVHIWQPVGLQWKEKHSVETQCYDDFCFLPFWEFVRYNLLSFDGQGGFARWRNIHSYSGRSLELRVPECVFMQSCVDVYECTSVCTELWWLLSYSGQFSWLYLFFLMPHCEAQLHTYTLSFPCWRLSLLFMSRRSGKGRTLDVNMPRGVELLLKELSFSPRLCSPILFDWPSFWSGQRRREGAPWRFSVGMTSLQNTFFCTLGKFHRSCYIGAFKGDCCADPKCCKLHLLVGHNAT